MFDQSAQFPDTISCQFHIPRRFHSTIFQVGDMLQSTKARDFMPQNDQAIFGSLLQSGWDIDRFQHARRV